MIQVKSAYSSQGKEHNNGELYDAQGKQRTIKHFLSPQNTQYE